MTTTDNDLADVRPVSGAVPTRRNVLVLAAVTGAGGLLAACGGGDEAADVTADPGEPAATSADESAPPAAGAGLVAVADVPVGGGVILESPQVVVTQPTEGTFKAFSSICTHQSCPVTTVEKNVIGCECHGSKFSATDGSVQGGPAPAGLTAVAVSVEGDQVVEA